MGIADLFLIGTAGSLAGETLSLLENSPVVTWCITLSQRLFIYLFFIYMNAYTSIHMWNISFHMCYQPLSNSILYSMFFFFCDYQRMIFFCVKYIGIAMV